MTNAPETTDVLVAGFGPVGAALANLLGNYGVQTVVVDKARDIFPLPRAIALDNEALRILQMTGLPADAFETLAIPTVRMHSPYAGQFMQADTSGSLEGHPRLVTFYQPELERSLRQRAARLPSVRTLLGLELTQVQQDEEGVRATLRDETGARRSIRARYLVGADGASSWVRQAIGQEFAGKTYAEDWLIVDAREVPRPIDHVEFVCDPQRPVAHMVAPNGRERWEFMLRPDETAEEMEQPERIRELLAPWGDAAQLDIERKAVYRFHARSADTFQSGRVFLAGDAAHITPPFAGQGLCAGLRDAANLSWKLAWVITGRTPATVLESYTEERQPHAKAMIELAKLMGRMIMPSSRPAALATHAAVRLLRMAPVTRAYLDELKIKPRNCFRRGLFQAPGGKSRMQRGAQLPQGIVRNAGGTQTLSDNVLGDGLVLAGFGHDPRQFLAAPDLARWRAAGGEFLQICHLGQRLHRSGHADEWEDLEGVLLPGAAPVGWVAVVRPDRTVMHDGPINEAAQIVAESLALLGTGCAPGSERRLARA